MTETTTETEIIDTVDKYAVVGNPITHSKSPQIHMQFAQQTAQLMSYCAILSEPEKFKQDLASFFSSGGKGLNVTVPFKLQAHAFSDQLSQSAELAGAVNTLIKTNNGIIGENTDGIGLVRDIIHNQGVQLNNKRILLIGAGGASRGVLAPLLEQEPSLVHVVNRTESKAIALEKLFSRFGNVQAIGFLSLAEQLPYDLIINASSAGLAGEAPDLSEKMNLTKTFCYDMVYAKTETPFITLVKSLSCENYCDGLGMLVEQAAESFKLWRGIRPETKDILVQLRAELS